MSQQEPGQTCDVKECNDAAVKGYILGKPDGTEREISRSRNYSATSGTVSRLVYPSSCGRFGERMLSVGEQVTPCPRCGTPCRLGSERNPDAQLLRLSLTPDGLCATCATADWLRHSPLADLIEARGVDCLLAPMVREQFRAIMRAGKADAQPGEIDWERLVEQWALPFPKVRHKRRKR